MHQNERFCLQLNEKILIKSLCDIIFRVTCFGLYDCTTFGVIWSLMDLFSFCLRRGFGRFMVKMFFNNSSKNYLSNLSEYVNLIIIGATENAIRLFWYIGGLTCVYDRRVCRLGWNWFGRAEVEVLIGCQLGFDVWYRLWRSSDIGFCSFGCCSGMGWLLWWNNCMCICSYGSRSDGLLKRFNSDSVTDTAVFMSAIENM
jgi:hypothetical protein